MNMTNIASFASYDTFDRRIPLEAAENSRDNLVFDPPTELRLREDQGIYPGPVDG